MSDIYVLVPGAWHTGAELEPAAEHIRKAGHEVHCVTLAGNRPQDSRATTGLDDAAQSVIDYLKQHKLNNVRLVGHSYGGMVISLVADKAPEHIGRLVYVNAFVPEPGQSLVDLVPPIYAGMFEQIAGANDGAISLPFPIWRDVFISDADLALAQSAYDKLNPQPYKTFTDKAMLKEPMAAKMIGKSYVNCREDVALPASLPWHPRLSERLGLFRYVECSGSHEVWFTDPQAIAAAVIKAGRD